MTEVVNKRAFPIFILLREHLPPPLVTFLQKTNHYG
jgi:hypothetical protein